MNLIDSNPYLLLIIMAASRFAQDPIHAFLMEAHSIVLDAQFVVDSLPNADLPAVERSAHQLGAVRRIVEVLEDDSVTETVRDELLQQVDALITPLDHFIRCPPPPASTFIPTERSEHAGRPRYQLDLLRVRQLHDLGNSYPDIAQAMGVSRWTLVRHLKAAGIPTARRPYTEIEDDDLDKLVAEISLSHPFVGSTIISGHLETRGIHVPRLRVQESLRRVDELGVLVRWAGIIRRRVYKVRGANALWHHDANEKIRPWGFYVHGCIDGHSRLIIYLAVCANKRKATVAELFKGAVREFGWPSRMRGDFGTENNEVERLIIERWGVAHRAYLRGRSRHNVRIERLWRDVRKDSLETYRQIFDHLEKNQLLDMDNMVHSTCLYLVFVSRIQASLDRTRDAWNHHKISTEQSRTPIAMFELSREAAIHRGYWTGDPGDDIDNVDSMYGFDGHAPAPPVDFFGEPLERMEQPTTVHDERTAGILLNDDAEIAAALDLLPGFNWEREDGNWGIDVYCEAVVLVTSALSQSH